MDADRHPHLRRLRPLLRIERALEVGGRRHGIAGALEGEEDAVSGPVDLAATVLGDRRPDELADPGQHRAVRGPSVCSRSVDASTSAKSRVTVPVGSGRALGSRPASPPASSSGGAVDVERRVLSQDRLLELSERTPGLDPQLVDECVPAVSVRRERLGLPARAVEREHQLLARPLSERMLGDEGLELTDELAVPPGGEVCVDPLLEAAQVELVQSGDLALGEVRIGELGQGRPAPELERLARHPVPHEPLEAAARRARRPRPGSGSRAPW